MSRRATVSIRVDDGLVLRPASPSVLNELQEAFEETWPEVSRAMPWIDIERDLKQQILSFLDETQRLGRSGLLHHWVMIDPRSERIMGLIGFDRVTRSTKSDWNLGYWVRSLNQKYGVAKRSIRAVLEWLGRGNSIVVELKVDP
ncbi:MAG: GNAT family N-acetyltransferase, partial [Candidatus Thermoplasmatota archaeon]|nr:GNAT family N-acetyltransferase [Candidatus Thermoplasmatota archaeon]